VSITILVQGISETKPDGIDRERKFQQKRTDSQRSFVNTLSIPEQVESETVTLNFSGVSFFSGDDKKLSLHNPVDTSTQTDSTEEGKLHACLFL